MGSGFWWGKMVLIGVLSLFFLVFSIENLSGAFGLNNPLEFIMYFFSASLMLLLSLVGLLYPIFQVHALFSLQNTHSDEK